MAKTLVDFRAEKGLYLKDLATALEMTEDELRAVEESGTVPEELGQRLILHYALPENYFSAPDYTRPVVAPSKKTPQKPMRYFILVSFVAAFIAGLIAGLPQFMYSMVQMALSFVSSISNNDINLIEISPIWNIFDTAFTSVIIVLFGIHFVKYITKHTTFEGNIAKYKFLYYSWPVIAASIPLSIVSVISTFVLTTVQSANPMETAGISLGITSITSIIALGVDVLAAYFCARLLNVAAFGDDAKQSKELRFLAIWVTISSVITIISVIAKTIIVNDFSLLSMITSLLSNVFPVVVIWLAATVKPKDEKHEKLIFTILPIIAACDSVVYGILYAIAG